MMRRILVYISIFLLFGCAPAAVPLLSQDQEMRAKKFVIPNDKASLYIYRTTSLHDEEPYMLFINGKLAGFTSRKTFLRFDLEPGSYDLISKAAMHSSLLTLDVQAGRNYFVWQDISSNGFYHKTSLQLVSEDEGRAGVMAGRLGGSGVSDKLHIENFQ